MAEKENTPKVVEQQAPTLVLNSISAVKQFAGKQGKKYFISQISDKTPEEADALFNRELSYAIQLISGKNQDYMIKTIAANPISFLFAIANCAASGLTLSPELKLAYLVPRDGKVMFQSSYMGKKEVVMASGLVKNVYAELVYKHDYFIVQKGTNPSIDHRPDYFIEDRGKIIGAYAVAFLSTGVNHIEVMSIEDVMKIKGRSPAADKGFSPWTTDDGEMIKKTLLNRIFKALPKLASSETLMRLIANDNEFENDIDHQQETKENFVDFTDES